jgi:hypothetical protein
MLAAALERIEMKRSFRARAGVLFLGLSIAFAASADAQTAAPDWSRWSFLMGDWVGGGSGQPGQGEGTFSFSLDLQGRVISRRSRIEYPASAGRPASIHEDLMIIFKTPGLPEKAVYFDNEGHAIEYVAILADDGNSVTFVSSWDFSNPIFRLTYTKTADGGLAVKFEMAQPDRPSEFKVYLEGRARRKS